MYKAAVSFAHVRYQCFLTFLALHLLCIATYPAFFIYPSWLTNHYGDQNLTPRLPNLLSKRVDGSVSVSAETDFSCYKPLVTWTIPFNSLEGLGFFSTVAWAAFIRAIGLWQINPAASALLKTLLNKKIIFKTTLSLHLLLFKLKNFKLLHFKIAALWDKGYEKVLLYNKIIKNQYYMKEYLGKKLLNFVLHLFLHVYQ